jgi:leucine dehydrogenase
VPDYVPDYVINAGGIINVSVELRTGGYDEAFAMRKIDTIDQNLEQVFGIAQREGIATNVASERLAERRLDAAKQNA